MFWKLLDAVLQLQVWGLKVGLQNLEVVRELVEVAKQKVWVFVTNGRVRDSSERRVRDNLGFWVRDILGIQAMGSMEGQGELGESDQG